MPRMPKIPRLCAAITLAVSALLPSCSRYFASDPSLGAPSGAVLAAEAHAPRALFMFEGSTGRTLGWADVMAAASWADAVFIGERHDDPAAHAVQLAIYEDLVSGYPGTAIALEHLERHEQSIVDRYLRGEIVRDQMIDETKSRDWAGKDTWVVFFQPLVDCAREHDAPVVAANAPRDLVRRARSEGHAALDALPAPERAWFDIPVVEQGSIASRLADDWNGRWRAYQSRFRAIMASSGEDPDAGEVRERLDALFLSQSVWDATMGASAADALERGAPKVVLCAGCFHVERDGGTVLQFEARRPRAKVLTVSVIDAASRSLRDEDRGAADIVVYGFPVQREKKAEPAAETPDAPEPAADSDASGAAKGEA